MFIIWGFRDLDKELGNVEYLHCNRCNNDSTSGRSGNTHNILCDTVSPE